MKKIYGVFACGTLFLGLGLGCVVGWIWPARSASKSALLAAAALCAVSLLCFLGTGAFLWLQKRARLKRNPRRGPVRSIDLDDSLRSLRAYGVLAPLYDESNFRSELVSLTIPRHFEFKKGSTVILEHWEGPDVDVQMAQRQLTLEPKQILRLQRPDQGLLLSPSDEPAKGHHLHSDSVVLMHVLEDA